jgi:hypothetical protein
MFYDRSIFHILGVLFVHYNARGCIHSITEFASKVVQKLGAALKRVSCPPRKVVQRGHGLAKWKLSEVKLTEC